MVGGVARLGLQAQRHRRLAPDAAAGICCGRRARCHRGCFDTAMRNRRGGVPLLIRCGKQPRVQRRQLVDFGGVGIERQGREQRVHQRAEPFAGWPSALDNCASSSITLDSAPARCSLGRSLGVHFGRGHDPSSTAIAPRLRPPPALAPRVVARAIGGDVLGPLASFEIRSSRRTPRASSGAALEQQRIPPHHRVVCLRCRDRSAGTRPAAPCRRPAARRRARPA